jgi:hypothetical protein
MDRICDPMMGSMYVIINKLRVFYVPRSYA